MSVAVCSVVRRLRCLSVLATVAALLPARATAMGAVVGRSGDLISMSSERVAVATAPSRTTRWVQVNVTGASAGFAWLVPVHPGARLDLGSDAWLDALDASTAPVILPPTTPGCIGGSDADLVAPTTSPISTSPTQTEVLTDLPSLTALLGDAGYPIPPELATRLTTVLASGDAIAALLFPSAKLPTHTLRIVDDGTPSLPFALSGTNFGDLAVTGFVVAAGPEAAGTAPITIDPSTVLWVADARSTYTQEGVILVQQSQGTRWLTQSSMPGLFFAGAPMPPSASRRPPARRARRAPTRPRARTAPWPSWTAPVHARLPAPAGAASGSTPCRAAATASTPRWPLRTFLRSRSGSLGWRAW